MRDIYIGRIYLFKNVAMLYFVRVIKKSSKRKKKELKLKRIKIICYQVKVRKTERKRHIEFGNKTKLFLLVFLVNY